MSLLSRLAVQAARAYGALSAKGGVSASYLVVAGGGGGGSDVAGGGGAGGLLTSTVTLSTLVTYTVTVGAGGAGTPSGARTRPNGTNGSNSILSGTGLTTLTATGGGGGGCYTGFSSGAGSSGGSGGGGGATEAGQTSTGGAGTASQGFAGGNGTTNGTTSGYNGGGGGGSGGVGAAGAGPAPGNGGNGGAGTASSISGSSVTYAGGGGGCSYTGTAGTASGGGGAGAVGAGNGTSGTANTGGGGGGAGTSGATGQIGGTGGSGVVIISYASATPKFVGGTLTTSGGNQIHTFTSSGTLSPLTPVTASYLVVAGGGGGADYGGGGAGGLLTSSTTLYSGATYVVTVGAGGAGGAVGANGSDSVLSGTGLTTLTAVGGGKGGNNTTPTPNGSAGGSGGGGRWNGGTGGAATSGQGFAGGSGAALFSTSYPAGGGGGAGAVGGNGTSGGAAGNGGIGLASSISGSSLFYAGGGGGGNYPDPSGNTNATGGSSVGGQGGLQGSGSTAGTTNRGGGGGGAGTTGGTGSSGGSGTVIISYAGSQVFNGGLVTSSGGNTIHTFNATGALTPVTNNLNNSLRFRGSNSAYLERTPTLSTNRTTWTWSAWVKRGSLGSVQQLFMAGSAGADYTALFFNSTDTLCFHNVASSANAGRKFSSAVYRDPSAWYHIVVVWNTTNATAGNRMLVYVNGVSLTAFGTDENPSLNQVGQVNNNAVHDISKNSTSSVQYFDGYMTDINFIDGQALEPYYFGNNDAYGNWKPILYKGMYGTNGFYLKGRGTDNSGNGNNWTENNFNTSNSALTTYDIMLDVPTNTSATVANYATWNPLLFYSTTVPTITNANLTAGWNNTSMHCGSTMTCPSTGKTYAEFTLTTAGSTRIGIKDITNYSQYGGGYTYVANTGQIRDTSDTTVQTVATSTNGDIIGIAVDLSANTIQFYKNNTAIGTAVTIANSANWAFWVGQNSSATAQQVDANFGQRPFAYTPPTGFVALNTYNLPTPTILQGNLYMDATLYTGRGTTQVLVNQGQFKPDLVWGKARSTTRFNVLVDSVRGSSKDLYSNATNAEYTDANVISSINSNGFSLGTDAELNLSAATFVAWQWQAGQGSTSSNTNGTITSTVSVNATAGFSVATGTTLASGTLSIGHGLGVSPAMVIYRSRNSAGQNWWVWHKSLPNAATGRALRLNTTDAEVNGAYFGTPSVSSTVVTMGAAALNSDAFVLYSWAEIDGFSKFGSYTGNGSTDGTFIYTGFRPKFILIKNTTTAGYSWEIFDTSRDTYNAGGLRLFAESSSAEVDSRPYIDILSNGFKLRSTGTGINGSGSTYIVMAFAENPFKNSNAR